MYEIWHGPPRIGYWPLRNDRLNAMLWTPYPRNPKEAAAALESILDRHPKWRVTVDPVDKELKPLAAAREKKTDKPRHD